MDIKDVFNVLVLCARVGARCLCVGNSRTRVYTTVWSGLCVLVI